MNRKAALKAVLREVVQAEPHMNAACVLAKRHLGEDDTITKALQLWHVDYSDSPFRDIVEEVGDDVLLEIYKNY